MTPGEDRNTITSLFGQNSDSPANNASNNASDSSQHDTQHNPPPVTPAIEDDYTFEDYQHDLEEAYYIMPFKTLSFTKPGSGGGGFYGDGRVVTWRNWRVTEHGLVKHGPDRVTVIEEYPPQCMLAIDLYAERTDNDDNTFPEFVTQYYGMGQLPLARLEALGWPLARLQASILAIGAAGQDMWKNRIKNRGGLVPSVDGQTPATEGAFFISETDDGMFSGSPCMQLFDEVISLANSGGESIEDRIAAHGVKSLDGLVAVAGTKELPKGKKQQQKEQLTGETKDAKKILVPVEVQSWPWDANVGTALATPASASKPAATTAPKAAAATKAAPAPAVAAATPAPAASPAADGGAEAGDNDIAQAVVDMLVKAGAGNSIKRGVGPYSVGLMRAFNGRKEIGKLVKRASSVEFLSSEPLNGLVWSYDPATEQITLAEGGAEMLAELKNSVS